MAPKVRRAQLLESSRFGSSGMVLKFRAERPWSLHPGQFVSILVPEAFSRGAPLKRCYSLAGSADETGKTGFFELCVTQVPHGRATGYLASLRPGDTIEFSGPFGDFFWDRVALEQAQDEFHRHHLSLDRLCFIGTGSGIAPLRAMILGDAGLHSEIPETTLIQGARTLSDIPYAAEWREMEATGRFRMKACLSRQNLTLHTGAPAFLPYVAGRVTDHLQSLPADWGFEHTQFFVCGSQSMLDQVRRHLVHVRGVRPFQIRCESFFLKQSLESAATGLSSATDDSEAGPLPLKKAS